MNGKEEKKTIVDAVDEQKTDAKPEFTEEQQAYIDRIVGGVKAENKQKLAQVTANNDQIIDEKVQEKLAEEKRRAEMSAEQKAAEDIKTLQNKNKQLHAELEQRDRLTYAHSIASQYHVPAGMVQRLVGKSDEETLNNMKEFADSFTKAVQDGIDKRIAGTDQPQQGSTVQVDDNKKLSDLSLEEQTQLYQENPSLYSQLANR